MLPSVERRPNRVQIPLVVAGAVLALFYAHQLPALTPPMDQVPPDAVGATLNDWSTVQLGLGLSALGIALTNRSALQRIRFLRFSRTQRLVLAACALALACPWVTSLGVGLTLGYGDRYDALWFGAFLLGFAGAVGFVAVGAWRFAELSLGSTEPAPDGAVDARRRTVLRGGGAAVLGAGTVTSILALGDGPLSEHRPAYVGRHPIVYERDDLHARPVRSTARIGESLDFELEATGGEGVGLGCHVPWALQAREDGHWHHATWTPGRFYSACASVLPAGETRTLTVPLSESAAAGERSPVAAFERELTPGTYRLVLVGTRPYLTVTFQVRPER